MNEVFFDGVEVSDSKTVPLIPLALTIMRLMTRLNTMYCMRQSHSSSSSVEQSSDFNWTQENVLLHSAWMDDHKNAIEYSCDVDLV
jgi:hypothetical protein